MGILGRQQLTMVFLQDELEPVDSAAASALKT